MFEDILQRIGMKKVDLAREFGMNLRTIYSWKDSPPQYVMAYLVLKKEFIEYKQTMIKAAQG